MRKGLKPDDIKKCTKNELELLCEQLRRVIYETVMERGGHLASNLGAVESTVALLYVFDFPNDKVVFDVGHQCYAYKLLTNRFENFQTLRMEGGISGFPKRMESEYDSYDTGHAGTSISAALGLAKAKQLKGENGYVIAYIGDGSFQNGLVYEALNSLKVLHSNVLIVLNDNGMSISPTVGGMSDILNGLQNTSAKENVRVLERFGLKYLGVKDGNDVGEMIEAFSQAKEMLATTSVLLHISTKKGKGYSFSEEHPTDTHGVTPVGTLAEKEYSQVLGETLCSLAKTQEKLVVVSAAMKEPLGLNDFFALYPGRAFDVGICEEHACVLCAAMAAGGLKPYYAIYSTFLQRAFDEIIHDVCAQDVPVTFCIDRAGISGADGETHQGVFDLSYLSFIPNLAIAVPKDTEEFKELLVFSAEYPHPLAIRYPRSGKVIFESERKPILLGKWEYLRKTNFTGRKKVTILACGERSLLFAMQAAYDFSEKGGVIDVVNARFVKPLDMDFLRDLDSEYVVTIEDNVFIGGFGNTVNNALIQLGKRCKIKNFAYEDCFIPQGNVQYLQSKYGVSLQELERYLTEILQ